MRRAVPVAVALRHGIPLVGVFAYGWSQVDLVLALLLDGLSTMLCPAAAAAWYTAGSLGHDREDWLDVANRVVGGFALFAFVAAVLAFAIGALALPIWLALLRDLPLDPAALLERTGLWSSFGAMLAAQTFRFVQIVREHEAATAREVVERDIGFVVARLGLVASAGTVLAVLPSSWALGAGVVVIQLVLAVTEIRGVEITPRSRR